MQIRTDLAIESAELYWETGEEKEIPGVKVEEETVGEIRISRVEILNAEGEAAIGKGVGRYVTIEMPKLLSCDAAVLKKAGEVLAGELSVMIKKPKLTLVAGLGNREITPDSLGPAVIPRLVITRHLFSEMPHLTESLSPVCAISPGVLGITGIETGEIIKGVCEKVHPDLVLVVDALASRKTERVTTSIQIADTGISPGSGVGNRRKAITAETMGVPVIAIGVPMVVDAATIASDTIDLVMDVLAKEGGGALQSMLQKMDREEKHALIWKAIPEEMRSMMVTPKDIDALAEKVAHVIARGINFALHPEISEEDMAALTSG